MHLRRIRSILRTPNGQESGGMQGRGPNVNTRENRHQVSPISLFGLLAIPFLLSLISPAVAQDNAKLSSQRKQLQSDMEYLASDELRGRGVGDEGVDIAADYLVARMKAIGLNTEAWDGSPKQPFEVLLGAQATNNQNNFIEVNSPSDNGGSKRWDLSDGYSPLAIGASIAKQTGPLIFAGYGITAKDLQYDDYEGIEADGAVVIVLRKEPQRNDSESRFNGTQNTRYALFNTKIKNAVDHGAAALIIVNDPDSIQAAIQQIEEEKQREKDRLADINQQLESLPLLNGGRKKQLRSSITRIKAAIASLEKEQVEAERGVLGMSEAGRRRPDQETIPIVSVGRDVVDQWIRSSSDTSLVALEAKIDETGQPASLSLADAQASLSVGIEPLNTETHNVLGYLDGVGELADQTLIIGAHYDHVGMGGNGSLAPGTIAVHNGADDNASGTVAMLSIAEQLTSRLANQDNRRRVVFIGFSAEERGLLGSKHYVKQPRFPLESTVSMINLDMVGRLNDNELTVYGTGSGKDFDGLIEKFNSEQEQPFQLFKMSSGYGPSDHQSFNEVGIPVLFFFTGIHNDYHRPSDDFDKINFDGLNRITDIVSDVAVNLATREKRPEFSETNRRVEIRRQMTAFLGISLQDSDGKVIVAAISEEGPAGNAGVEVGDQIQKIAGREVTEAADVINWVRTQSPGKPAKLSLLRAGETMELSVELGKRPAQ